MVLRYQLQSRMTLQNNYDIYIIYWLDIKKDDYINMLHIEGKFISASLNSIISNSILKN
jgi:hypothetical protein